MASDEVGRVLRFVEDSDAKSGTELARYSDGKLVPVATAPRMDSLTAVRGQQACVLEYADLYGNDPAIVCYDADGEVARIDVTGRGVGHFSIAPDGSIWLLGPQAARLPQKLADP